jgi:hypothetical protein
MGRRAIDDTASSVLGLSLIGNTTYFGVRSVWNFLRGRWGAPIDRQERLTGYSSLRNALALDTSLNPRLRALIAESVEQLSVNPFERSLKEEAQVSVRHYQALIAWVRSPDGLAARLDQDRRREMVARSHGKAVRGLFVMARVASLGLYSHREKASPVLMAQLDRKRRLDYHMTRLREALDSSPRPEVVVNVQDVRNSLEELTILSGQDASSDKRISKLVTELFGQTADDGLRRQCLEALARIRHPAAAKELAQLLADPNVSAWLNTEMQFSGRESQGAKIQYLQGGESQ